MKKQHEQFLQIFIACCLGLTLALFVLNWYLLGQVKTLQHISSPPQAMPMMGTPMSRMSFSEFDKSMAKQFMDKNNDGLCDSCGMPIDQCIASGMMQCSMDPNAKIGTLGSQHIHADWKIYIDGKTFDWSPYADLHQKQMMGDTSIAGTSAFMHIHPAQAPEVGGDVLHMHATGVPLSMFFESLKMKLTKTCLELSKSEKYCGTASKKLRMYVNGKENTQLGDYVFEDLDKILITYGTGNVKEQLKSITNFGGTH